ncbi:hypothetical protein SCH01S_28_01640 [Sphingomonas changbaiensis NBRC 104936]|uniref:Uncharacterized protein n=1 Tax=Sphingomonas changbaiensis NBRC 104936 TaxID=1219043 RepID=A0A0E9MP62_9SPHN|nr:hypothetical protein SCH01S_28_01640 [Sphingomonas changbaiensis NBRC 104936]
MTSARVSGRWPIADVSFRPIADIAAVRQFARMTAKKRLIAAYLFIPASLAVALLALPQGWQQLAFVGPLVGAGYAFSIIQSRRSCGHGPLSLGPGRIFWPWPFDCPTCGAAPD